MANEIQQRVIEHARDDIGATEDPRRAWQGAAEPAKPGFWEKVQDHIIDRVLPEVGNMLVQKTAHGATELSQALYNGQGFTPYGHAQAPLEIEGPATSYQDMLRDSAERAHQDQNRGMDR